MIITSLEKYKGSTYEVTVDKQKIYLHKDIILDFGIKVSKEISEEKLEEILEASEKRRAFERAMYLLDYRDYSYRELFGKLSESYEEDICFYVLNKLAGLVKNGFVVPILVNERIRSYSLSDFTRQHEKELKKKLSCDL